MPRQAGSAQMASRLGERVKELRQEVGLTQERLAWDCDLAKPYVSQLEAGKRLPSVPVLYRLAERLGVDVVELLSVERERPVHRLVEAYRRRDVEELRRLVGGLGLPVRTGPGAEGERRAVANPVAGIGGEKEGRGTPGDP